ncbi:hypothetical protein GGR52DRAFT_577642 [Hypoxylon sp. FL1284]|nr:hypothetical protein GGR52DRAFT_577642 [Hypoxylon sp. FL1284]
MPRPRRTRVASTRTATKAGSATADAPQQQPEDASSDIYDVSDREKEKAKERRGSMRDAPSAASRPRPAIKEQEKALESARQQRDLAMQRLEKMTSTSSNQVSESIERSDDSIELGRKVAGTPKTRRMADVSGMDLDDDMFDDLNTTFDTADPASAQRSAETSTMSASVFKRRPRAGSFLSREDGYIRPSSRTGPTTPGLSSGFNIGVFKKRTREPSILGTAQKPRPQRIEHEPEPDSEPENEELAEAEDAFAPEAESTPLKRSKKRSDEVEVDRTPSASTSAHPRKRKSSEGHERRSRSPPFEEHGLAEDAVVPQTDSDLSSPPSTPPARVQSSSPATPIMDEELLAPPLSSSPSAEDEEIWPPLQSLGRGRLRRPASALRRTPVPHDNVSDMSSPPSLTYSPNYREPTPPPRKSKRRPASSKQEAKKVLTADLAGLLPRRRRRNAAAGEGDDSDAEVDMSGLGNDDDELAHLDVRARRRPASRAGNAANHQAPTTRAKSKQAPPGHGSAANSSNRRATITYGRASDKENQDVTNERDDDESGPEEEEEEGQGGSDSLGDESSQDMLARVGQELKNATRKFQEVDKWQLDYEEMTQSSSPRDAR